MSQLISFYHKPKICYYITQKNILFTINRMFIKFQILSQQKKYLLVILSGLNFYDFLLTFCKMEDNIKQSIQMNELKLQPEFQVVKNQQQDLNNNLSLLSVSQSLVIQKQQKQSSNDGLNSERSYPSTTYNKDQKQKIHQEVQKDHLFKKKKQLNSKNMTKDQNVTKSLNLSDYDNQKQEDSEDSQLKYASHSSTQSKNASLTLIKLLFIIFKKEYAFQIVRVLLYAFISITIFAYVLDQSKEKKQFYEAFYTSQQITISKSINGVFPPLFGTENDLLNHTWILQTYNSNLLSDSEEQRQDQELLFEFKTQKVLYIRPSSPKCLQQLKFKFKTFDYNMRIYQIVESEFQKITDQTQEKSCFFNKKEISKLMRQISIWTIDWQSKQLYLLSEPFKDQPEPGQVKAQRWTQLIVLKKQSLNI